MSKAREKANSSTGSIRPGVAAAIVVAGLILAFAFRMVHSRSSRNTAQDSGQQSAPVAVESQASTGSADENVPVEVAREAAATAPVGQTTVSVSRPRGAETGSTPGLRPEPSPYTRDLVTKLSRLDQSSIPRTPEQVVAWKQNLQQLLQQGPAAVPAIREFLERNVDLGFGGEASQALGYGSARYAMFDALAQIGGPEATQALLDTLQTAADPREIAMLARSLDRLGADAHRQEILDATRQALNMASEGKLAEADVGPLFEVMSKYGGADIAAELEQNSGRYRYYSAIALAQLPDGTGVPSLIRMAQDPAGGQSRNIPVLEMLAQSAAQYPDAAAALLQLVQNGQISSRSWPYLTSILGGDRIQYRDSMSDPAAQGMSDVKTFHIAGGNQNFYSSPNQNLTPDQINRQLQFIDSLLGATADPNAIQALQTARNTLSKRGR